MIGIRTTFAPPAEPDGGVDVGIVSSSAKAKFVRDSSAFSWTATRSLEAAPELEWIGNSPPPSIQPAAAMPGEHTPVSIHHGHSKIYPSGASARIIRLALVGRKATKITFAFSAVAKYHSARERVGDKTSIRSRSGRLEDSGLACGRDSAVGLRSHQHVCRHVKPSTSFDSWLG